MGRPSSFANCLLVLPMTFPFGASLIQTSECHVRVTDPRPQFRKDCDPEYRPCDEGISMSDQGQPSDQSCVALGDLCLGFDGVAATSGGAVQHG